jgi:hypothetical protein
LIDANAWQVPAVDAEDNHRCERAALRDGHFA